MNTYTLMRAHVTLDFIVFDLYNEETHTNFEVKLCVSSKRCLHINILREKINGYVCQKANIDDWIKILETIDNLFYREV